MSAEYQAERRDEFSERPGCTIKGMGLETASKLCLIRSIAGVSRALMSCRRLAPILRLAPHQVASADVPAAFKVFY